MAISPSSSPSRFFEKTECDLLFRWFVWIGVDAAVWDQRRNVIACDRQSAQRARRCSRRHPDASAGDRCAAAGVLS